MKLNNNNINKYELRILKIKMYLIISIILFSFFLIISAIMYYFYLSSINEMQIQGKDPIGAIGNWFILAASVICSIISFINIIIALLFLQSSNIILDKEKRNV
jgi:hypothetical protein